MDVPTQLELCLYDQLDTANLLSTRFLTAIPTPFLFNELLSSCITY